MSVPQRPDAVPHMEDAVNGWLATWLAKSTYLTAAAFSHCVFAIGILRTTAPKAAQIVLSCFQNRLAVKLSDRLSWCLERSKNM